MNKIVITALALLGITAIAQNTSKLESIRLELPKVTLNGTLTIPIGSSGKIPVVLIIAGSGATDQNGNSVGTQFQSNSYKLLAQALAAKGIASLRYDKRGVSTSQSTQTETELRFDDYANDASALLEKLKTDTRFSGVYIIGHSEGSLLGVLAAQKTKVTGYISLAGAGRRISDILLEQLTPQVTTAMLEEIKRVFAKLQNGELVPSKEIQLPTQLVQILFRDSVQPYLISWFQYDPAEEIKKLQTRILILQGSTDTQVSIADAQRLGNAIGQQPTILTGMNHVLKLATLEPSSQNAAYTNPNLAIAPSLLIALEKFIVP